MVQPEFGTMRVVLVLCALVVSGLLEAAVSEKQGGSDGQCDSTSDAPCDLKTEDEIHTKSLPPDAVVSYEQLKDMLSSRSVQLFDIREPDEFEAGRIEGATNIPLGVLDEAFRLTPDQFKERYGVSAPQKEDTDFVLHCQMGRRSITALEIVWALGYSRARHYAGGYSEWAQREGHSAEL